MNVDTEITTHHLHPTSKQGKDVKENREYVFLFEHRIWHNIFINFSPISQCIILNRIWKAFKNYDDSDEEKYDQVVILERSKQSPLHGKYCAIQDTNTELRRVRNLKLGRLIALYLSLFGFSCPSKVITKINRKFGYRDFKMKLAKKLDRDRLSKEGSEMERYILSNLDLSLIHI